MCVVLLKIEVNLLEVCINFYYIKLKLIYMSAIKSTSLSCLSIWQRRRKRVHEGSENVDCKRPKAAPSSVNRAGGSHGKQRHVEAVTLFEVVTMGRSAMQVK